MAASVARCASVNRTRAGKCERRVLFSAIRYSLCSGSCWFTMPVTYANSRATCVFFIETHHHNAPVVSMSSGYFTKRVDLLARFPGQEEMAATVAVQGTEQAFRLDHLPQGTHHGTRRF